MFFDFRPPVDQNYLIVGIGRLGRSARTRAPGGSRLLAIPEMIGMGSLCMRPAMKLKISARASAVTPYMI